MVSYQGFWRSTRSDFFRCFWCAIGDFSWVLSDFRRSKRLTCISPNGWNSTLFTCYKEAVRHWNSERESLAGFLSSMHMQLDWNVIPIILHDLIDSYHLSILWMRLWSAFYRGTGEIQNERRLSIELLKSIVWSKLVPLQAGRSIWMFWALTIPSIQRWVIIHLVHHKFCSQIS